MKGSKSPGRGRWALLALVAVLGLTMVVGTGGSAASTPGHAVQAKKCKKKKHRSATSAKKKKCKKKKIVLPLPGPMVRATATWTSSPEVDLHAFDAAGNHTGWVNPTGVVNGIPNAVHSGDQGGPSGTESFTDNIFVQGGNNREFAYVVCIYGGGSVNFTGTTASGQTSSVPLSGAGDYTLTVPTSPPVPYDPC